MNIAIASDHAGFDQKTTVTDYLHEQGYTVEDFGPATDESVDYPDFAEMVARTVAEGMADFGILLCGTGIGMAMAANKIEGIRAANITNPELAPLAREHNDANVLTLSARYVDAQTNIKIIKSFLATPFGEGRHAQRVEKIKRLEVLD
ncbi:MAG: ribose 5-phosphate isomerase B [Coriobacteriia bacterium]|jgi:ribose 5-phosphate isomerase B|nr:ribose 5-phosphate isomerase B [Coriobacteriia bacterium]MDR2713985.1 ribose 5-phosphate isomerase B [Coriobacteriales bacterium]